MSSRDVRNDGDDEDDVALVDALAGDGSPPCEPTSPPKPVTATVTNGTTKAELPRRTKAAMSEVGPKTEATPLAAMRVKLRRSGGRPAEVSKARRKLSPELMRIVIESLRERPILSHAAGKAGIHRRTLEYWMKCSKAGKKGYDIEWQGMMWRFHEHCQTAIEEAHDKILLAAWDSAMGGVVYKNDKFLLSLGYEGPDAYLRDENGIPVLETMCKANPTMLRFLLELLRPHKWVKHPKIDVPQKGGVVIIGDITKKPENSSAASIKARQWKSRSKRIRGAKT